MRLDVFLPMLRRPREGQPQRAPHLLTRIARRFLPSAWFSNTYTKQPGLARRMLRFLGRSWVSAPVRRLVQAVCFGLFLYLFFVVCWPYNVRPSPVSRGWLPLEVDAGSGRLLVSSESRVGRPALGDRLWIGEPDAQPPFHAGPFRVVESTGNNLRLQPERAMTAETLDRLAVSTGPWVLQERDPASWPSHHADALARKELLPAESFLAIDPLVSLSTALAGRAWVWSLASALGILMVCVLVPRGFCGYLCPLGTLIDLFDWSIARRFKRLNVADNGWWVHVKYYLLAGILVTSLCGILTSGTFAAIPVITRGFLYTLAPLQTGLTRGWHQVPPLHAGHVLSIGLFLAVLGLGFLKPRFWCKYVCPSGAMFSLGNLFRVSERKVESSCIHCNKCVEVCPFDAIKPDFTTRTADCTLCQTCGGVCPTHAIKFVDRWNLVQLKVENEPPTRETPLGRRGFLATAVGLSAGAVGGLAVSGVEAATGARLDQAGAWRPVRPPGSVPEQDFLQLCIRCGECFKACPNDVLQSMGFQQGLEGLWTPFAVPDWAGCDSSCNACGQVCPTGAIRGLPLAEKRACRMGLAIVDLKTCLPHAQREACQLCVDECVAAGYNAIEFTRVGTQADENGQPVEGTGYLAPVVRADMCVGCGLCQTRCYGINAAEKKLLSKSAIVVEAGPGKEDRLRSGSYIALRQSESAKSGADNDNGKGDYLPEFLK